MRAVSKRKAVEDRVWRLVRQEALERDGYRCQICGHRLWTGGTNVHHRLRRSRGGAHTLENLVSLCDGPGTNNCHGRVHANPEWSYTNGWLLRSGMEFNVDLDEPLHDYTEDLDG